MANKTDKTNALFGALEGPKAEPPKTAPKAAAPSKKRVPAKEEEQKEVSLSNPQASSKKQILDELIEKKKKKDGKPCSFYLTAEQYKKVQKAAKQKKMSQSELIGSLIDAIID